MANKNILVRHISAAGRVTATRSLASSAGCQLQDKLSGGKYFYFETKYFLHVLTNIYRSVAACLPSPAPTPGWRRLRPATPSLRRRRVLLLWATRSPRQSSPSHPHPQVPPDTTIDLYLYKPKTTLTRVEMAKNLIKSIAGFPTTKPLYPSIPGK